jgi:hypothetical protein
LPSERSPGKLLPGYSPPSFAHSQTFMGVFEKSVDSHRELLRRAFDDNSGLPIANCRRQSDLWRNHHWATDGHGL